MTGKEKVVNALLKVTKSANRVPPSKGKTRIPLRSLSASSDSSSSSIEEKDNHSDEVGQFSVEHAFSASNLQLSVEGVGQVSFPITEEVIQKIISKSKKAVFGKGEETVLDLEVRDTQVIPAKQLEVTIDDQTLGFLLDRVAKEINLEPTFTLVPHLYNLLVYGPGQFFKAHRDSEKVPNMIATLILVLPSPHTGGDLKIRHKGASRTFFGSPDPNIIKCVAFYPDCYHEIEKVETGNRVALTYNIELRGSPVSSDVPVDENLRHCLISYFKNNDEEEREKLVFLLDHKYSKNSLKWSMMKGIDRTRVKALLGVAKAEGYSPCLALTEYYVSECLVDPSCTEREISFYYWVSEDEVPFDFKPRVNEDEVCCSIKTEDLFEPYQENSGTEYNGNEDVPHELWYRRAAIVIWKNRWNYSYGYKQELEKLHLLTKTDGEQKELKEKLRENADNFYVMKFWESEDVTKMVLDIVLYLNHTKFMLKVFTKLSPEKILNLENTKVINWILTTVDLESWMKIMVAWKCNHSGVIFKCVTPFILYSFSWDNKDFSILKYLFREVVTSFSVPTKKRTEYSFYASFRYSESNANKEAEEYIANLKTLIEIGGKLGENVIALIDRVTDSLENVITDLEKFQKLRAALNAEQLHRYVSCGFLDKIIDSTFRKIESSKPPLKYSEPNKSSIDEFCSLVKVLTEVHVSSLEEKIFPHLASNPTTYTALFLGKALEKLRKSLSSEQLKGCRTLQKNTLQIINSEMETFTRANDWHMPIKINCTCKFCHDVNEFFASSSRMEIGIRASQANRAHVTDHLKAFSKFPIKLETIRTGSPHTLLVKKLPELETSKESWKKQLLLLKKKIGEVTLEEVVSGNESGPLPPKILIKEELIIKNEVM